MITTDYDRLSKDKKDILLFLLDNITISRKEAVSLLNLGETKIKEIFNELINVKLIEIHGQGRSTYYTLKK